VCVCTVVMYTARSTHSTRTATSDCRPLTNTLVQSWAGKT